MTPLELLIDEHGYEDLTDMCEDYGDDSIVPAICIECHASFMYEPDCNCGYCDNCGTNTVQSFMILGGLI